MYASQQGNIAFDGSIGMIQDLNIDLKDRMLRLYVKCFLAKYLKSTYTQVLS